MVPTLNSGSSKERTFPAYANGLPDLITPKTGSPLLHIESLGISFNSVLELVMTVWELEKCLTFFCDVTLIGTYFWSRLCQSLCLWRFLVWPRLLARSCSLRPYFCKLLLATGSSILYCPGLVIRNTINYWTPLWNSLLTQSVIIAQDTTSMDPEFAYSERNNLWEIQA